MPLVCPQVVDRAATDLDHLHAELSGPGDRIAVAAAEAEPHSFAAGGVGDLDRPVPISA